MTANQLKYASSLVKQLKKHRSAGPFLAPVDPVALNIPHYFSIITQPSDLRTVDERVQATIKGLPNGYANLADWEQDLRRIFRNTERFNGIEHPVTQMGHTLEEAFEKHLKKMPSGTPKPSSVAGPSNHASPASYHSPTSSAAPAPKPKPSTSGVPEIRRTSDGGSGRPKREIHAPIKDLPYVLAEEAQPKKRRKSSFGGKGKNAGTPEQMRFCQSTLKELNKNKHIAYAAPFYDPVDWHALGLPDYPKIVKKPMDLSTIKSKLDNGEYDNPSQFEADIRLMFRNCYSYNPKGSPVHEAGRTFEGVFDAKWADLPPAVPEPESDYDEDDDLVDDDPAVKALEAQLEQMKQSLADLKNKKRREREKAKAKAAAAKAAAARPPPPPPPPPAPKAAKAPKPAKRQSTGGGGGGGGKGAGKKRSPASDDEDDAADDGGYGEVTFDMKKELAEKIQELDGDRLDRAIKIIHESRPDLKDSSEEIELDIDVLPIKTLHKLYNFVVRPKKRAAKRSATGEISHKPKRAGTGGVKRKSMNEDEESEKIRKLEERLQNFDNAGGAAATPYAAEDDEASSGSESDSGSGSDSDSE